jgi:hypothetical protein
VDIFVLIFGRAFGVAEYRYVILETFITLFPLVAEYISFNPTFATGNNLGIQ